MINGIYEQLIAPANIRAFFKTEELFIDWLKKGTLKDLHSTLKIFEQAEMYEDCIIIKRVMMHVSKQDVVNTDS